MHSKQQIPAFHKAILLICSVLLLGCNLFKPSKQISTVSAKTIHYGDTAKFDVSREFKKRIFIYNGDTLPYREFNYSSLWEKPLPIVIFLHGSGEKGNDNESQLSHGAEWIWRAAYAGFACHAIFPQCNKNSYWSNVNRTQDSSGKPHFTFHDDTASTKAMKLLMAFVDHLKKESYIDPSRMYLGGLSMGGMGTIELMRRMPKTFAAAFPICGGGKIANFKPLKKTHWWLFHGLKDNVVPPENSIELATQLTNAGIDAKITLFPNANHNSWDPTFAEPGLLPWMFNQRLK
jgi:predicted peptidase